MKRFLSLALVCLMLTPIISFATNDSDETTDENTVTDTTVENTEDDYDSIPEGDGAWILNKNSQATYAKFLDDEKVLPIREFLAQPEADRKPVVLDQAVVETSKEDIEGHSYVCTRGGYELYFKADQFSVLIRDAETGAILRSTLSKEEASAKGYSQTQFGLACSGIVVHYLRYADKDDARYGQYTDNDGDYATAIDLLGDTSDSATEIKTEEIKEGSDVIGFKSHLNFTNYGIEMDVEITMEEDGSLNVYIPQSSLKENSKYYYIGEIYVFPFMGYSDRGDREGYMILPDGNGIITRFSDYFKEGTGKYTAQYYKKVYGSDAGLDSTVGASLAVSGDGIQNNRNFTTDAEIINLPYYGMVFEDTDIAVLGMITEGEEGATIVGNINGTTNHFENFAFSKFQYRTLYIEYGDSVGNSERKLMTKNLLTGDVNVKFLFTSKEEASYSGLANKLRTKLLDLGIINKTDNTDFKIRLDFLGVDKEDFLIFRRNVVATTVDDIREILDELKAAGVENVVAVYEGWQEDGVYNVPISDFDADGDVGGNDAIEDLFAELKEDGNVEFYLIQDMTTINTALTSSVFTSINAYTGKTFEYSERFNEVFQTFRYLFPEKSKEYIIDLADDLLDSDITSVAFSGISEKLFSYMEDKEHYTRNDAMKYYTEALEHTKDSGMKVALKQPFMYQLKYTDEYLDFCIGSSMYVYADTEIPFLSSVLRGSVNLYSEYINFEANSTEYFLKLIETGVNPSFLLTKESPSVLQYTNSNWNYSSEYEKYKDTIAEYYTDIKAVFDKVEGEYIVDHERLDSNVSITTYSNGVKFYVNFSDVDVTVDDITIEAESYIVR